MGAQMDRWMDESMVGRIDESRDVCLLAGWLAFGRANGTIRIGIDERMPPREEFAQLKSEEELSISLTNRAPPLSLTMRRR